MISDNAQPFRKSRTINTTRYSLSNISNIRNLKNSHTLHKYMTELDETNRTLNFNDVICNEKVIDYE